MYISRHTYIHQHTNSIQVYCEANCVKYNYFVKLTNVTRRMRKPFFFAAGYICTYLLRYFSLPRSFMKREIVLNWNVFVTTTRPANWKSIFRLCIVSPVPSPQQLSSFSAHSTLKHSSVGASFPSCAYTLSLVLSK